MQATTPPDDHDKASWRRHLRGELRTLETIESQSAAIRLHLSNHLESLPKTRIAAYAAIAGEVDLTGLVEASRHQWHFPRIEGDQLFFHQVEGAGDFESGQFGIRTPRNTLPGIAANDIDLILVPGLGFGRDGTRLGRGRGFYDRFMTRLLPETPRIGVALLEQLVDRLPTEAHDLRMSHLLTKDGLQPVP